jgi:hypothetical protein
MLILPVPNPTLVSYPKKRLASCLGFSHPPSCSVTWDYIGKINLVTNEKSTRSNNSQSVLKARNYKLNDLNLS